MNMNNRMCIKLLLLTLTLLLIIGLPAAAEADECADCARSFESDSRGKRG